MYIVYKFNGPARPEEAFFDAQDRSNDGLRRRRGRKDQGSRDEPHHLQLPEFSRLRRQDHFTHAPSLDSSGRRYWLKPDSDGSWFYALAVATQHKLASMSRDNYRKEDYRNPTITFVPLEHDGMTGVTKFAYKVADLPPHTRAYIEAEPRQTYKVADLPQETRAFIEAKPKTWTFTPETQASLEADPKWKAFLLRLELMSSVTTPAGRNYNVFKMKGEETSLHE